MKSKSHERNAHAFASTLKSLSIGKTGKSDKAQFYSIPALAKQFPNIKRLPVSLRIVLESVLRLIASPVLLPIEWLRFGPQPRDGADVCTDPLRGVAR